jgi:hypothetical protein
MLEGGKMMNASEEVRISDFGFVRPRNDGSRKYVLLLIALTGGKIVKNPN